MLLDLAYDLQLGSECSLPAVLRALPPTDDAIVHQDAFKSVKGFHDDRMDDLEAGRGAGARNEATHLLSPSVRFFGETIERLAESGPGGRSPSDWVALLVEHHAFLTRGILDACTLVERRFPVG